MLYTLNLYSTVCQLHLNKTEKKLLIHETQKSWSTAQAAYWG